MTTHEKFTAASAEYLRRLRWNNLSQKTLQNYEQVLRLFGAYLSDHGEDHDGDLYAIVEQWRDAMLEQGAQPSTVRQYMVTLKIFFDRATRRSFPAELRYQENPVDDDLFPKQIKKPYKEILTDEQVMALYKNTPPPYAKNWARNYAMLMLLVNEKIRNAELLDLRLSDLDFIHHELTVREGKGRKTRVVDLSELSELAVAMYLDSGLRPGYLKDDDYLFGTTAAHERGNITTRQNSEAWHRGTTAWASGVIERTVYAITGVRNVRSHALRHIGARVCLNAGHSLEQLQGELGHAQITTTTIYSGRLLQRRRRDSAKAVLAARDAAAEQLRPMLQDRNRESETVRYA